MRFFEFRRRRKLDTRDARIAYLLGNQGACSVHRLSPELKRLLSYDGRTPSG